MGREGWIYVAVFLAVLIGGAILIAPRLGRSPTPAPPPSGPPSGPGNASGTPSGSGRSEDDALPWCVVHVRAADGPLRGPLKPVRGAEVQPLDGLDGDVLRLRVRPHADEVAFGAAGHQWTIVPAARLATSKEVVLLPAAPPIVLRVREPDGRPAPAVPILVRPSPPDDLRRTDDGGTVVIDDVPLGLVLVDVGGVERRGPSLRLVAGADRDVRVLLEPAWHIRGVVVDARSEPLGGATVRVFGPGEEVGRAVETDEEGRFLWTGPVRGAVSVRIEVPGLAAVSLKSAPPARGTLETDLGEIPVTRAGARLVGQVVGARVGGSRPVVRIEPAVAAPMRELFGEASVLDRSRRPTLAADGTFVVEGLPPGIPQRVAIRGDFLPIDAIVLPGIGEELHETWTPPAGHRLEGRVIRAETRAPVGGLSLRLSTSPRDLDGPLPGDRTIRTDEEGRFQLGGLPRGALFLRAYPRDGRPLLHRIELPRTEGVDLASSAALRDAGHRVRGRVVDELNVPLPGVTVRAAGRRMTTDAEGRFRLEGVEGTGSAVPVSCAFEPGTSVNGVDPRPFASGVRRLVEPGGDPVKLVLPRTKRIRMRVTDGLDDAPLSFVHVVIRTDAGELLVDRAVAPLDGHVTLGGLAPRGLLLAVFSHVHRRIRSIPLNALQDPGTEVDLGTVRLVHGIRIEGRIVDPRGTGVPGARIGGVESGWLRSRSPDPTVRRELALRHTKSDAQGRFTLEGFDPRRPATLAVWAPGFAPTGRRIVLEEFQDDVGASLTVQVRHGGYLAIELEEAGTERPISGALLDLEDARNGSDYLDLLRRGMLGGAIGSDRDWRLASEHLLPERGEPGRYRIGPIEPGPYEVWVDRPGYVTLRRKLTILDPRDGLTDLTQGTSRELSDVLQQTWVMEPAR